MSQNIFLPAPDEQSAAAALRAARLPWPGRGELRVAHLGGTAFEVRAGGRDWIARFPADTTALALLEKEARVQQGLRAWVTLALPQTRLVDPGQGRPVFALHPKIAGEALTGEMYAALSAAARERLVHDLATFYRECHAVPLPVAQGWLGESASAREWAARTGKPLWFAVEELPRIRAGLAGKLSPAEMAVFEATLGAFGALPRGLGWMVFGHGDLHGYNMAMVAGAQGQMVIRGVFDLGCAGILDAHEDFFRLALVSRDLLERVVAAYRALGARVQGIDLSRARVYYRAFLFYLMAEQEGAGLEHLRDMLREEISG